jgi:hypothetical protein
VMILGPDGADDLSISLGHKLINRIHTSGEQ